MTPAELLDAVIANLDEKYELIYVDQSDKLMFEQITAVVECNREVLWESNWEWESDSRRSGANYEAEIVVRDTFQALEREGRIEDSDEAYDDFHHTDEWDEVIEAIEQRDHSDPYKELAGNSGYVLMRQQLRDSIAEPLSARKVVDAIRVLGDNSLTLSEHNRAVIEGALNNTDRSACIYALLVYSVAVSDLYEIDEGRVAIRNPHLFLGDPGESNGWVSDEPLDATFWFDRGALTSDTSCWGYSWKDTCGCSDSAYQAEITKVVPPDLSTPEKVVQYLTA